MYLTLMPLFERWCYADLCCCIAVACCCASVVIAGRATRCANGCLLSCVVDWEPIMLVVSSERDPTVVPGHLSLHRLPNLG